MSCPKTTRCPLYPLFQLEALLEVWKIRYCENDRRFPTCQRFVRSGRGEDVPRHLLPNGDMMETLED